MKTRCPNCGATLSLDALIAHDDARAALRLLVQLGGDLATLTVRYLGLFRPTQTELTFARVAKLLGEILPDIQAQRIERKGAVYDAPPAAWLWAMQEVLVTRDSGKLTLPLKKPRIPLRSADPLPPRRRQCGDTRHPGGRRPRYQQQNRRGGKCACRDAQMTCRKKSTTPSSLASSSWSPCDCGARRPPKALPPSPKYGWKHWHGGIGNPQTLPASRAPSVASAPR